jgi:hypothetical protein
VAGYGGPRSGSRLRPRLRTGVCPVPCRTFIGAPLRAYFLREEGHPCRILIYLCYILQPMVGDDPVPRVLQHVPWLGEAPSTQAGALVQACD